MSEYVSKLLAEVKSKNQNEPEFHQAVQEIMEVFGSCIRTTPGIPFCKNS